MRSWRGQPQSEETWHGCCYISLGDPTGTLRVIGFSLELIGRVAFFCPNVAALLFPQRQYGRQGISQAEQTIEAEVVEIDGVAVEPRPASKQAKNWNSNNWATWQRRVKKLDARWWPLWLVLGFVVMLFVVAVGMCAAVVWIAYKLTIGLFVGFLSLFSSPTELQRR